MSKDEPEDAAEDVLLCLVVALPAHSAMASSAALVS